jgi:hypothetical protein
MRPDFADLAHIPTPKMMRPAEDARLELLCPTVSTEDD